MAKTYKHADHELRAALDKVVEANHPTLHEAHVSFGIRLVFAPLGDDDEPKGPALTREGWPVNGILTVTGLKDRLFLPDVIIDLDGRWTENANEEEIAAQLDQLCESIFATIGEDEARTVKSDSPDRPVLTRREPDLHFKGYSASMKRGGRFAPEAVLLENLTSTMEQAELPFPEAATSAPKAKRKRGAPGRAADAVRAAAEAVEELAEEIADAAAESVPRVSGRRPISRGMLDVVHGGAP